MWSFQDSTSPSTGRVACAATQGPVGGPVLRRRVALALLQGAAAVLRLWYAWRANAFRLCRALHWHWSGKRNPGHHFVSERMTCAAAADGLRLEVADPGWLGEPVLRVRHWRLGEGDGERRQFEGS